MATFSYTVVSAIPPGPSSSSDPVLAPADGISACIPRFSADQDFLDLYDRILPFEYIEPLKDPGPGYELLQAFAAIMERVSLAVGRTECCLYITTSHGGNKAEAEVEFSRPNTSTGVFTVRSGTRVRCSGNNLEFELVDDLEFGALDLTKIAVVRARQEDFAFNVRGIRYDANGNELEGEIDEVSYPILDPPFAERNIAVRQLTDAIGGQSPCLDLHGKDRSIERQPGETDDEYRYRVRTLPDTISPEALIRQLESVFIPLGITFDFIETFENRYQSCWDAPLTVIPNLFVGDFDPTLFCYDDPRGNIPFRNRWMSGEDHVGGVIVVVPNLSSFEEQGMVFDDPAETSADHETALGRRAHSAYDVPPAESLDPELTLGSALDGDDAPRNAFFRNLADLLRKIKAAGVSVVIEQEGQ